MKRGYLIAITIAIIFLLTMSIVHAHIFHRAIGVKVGDWVKYTIHKSHNPRTWISEMYDAEWVLVNVTNVDGTWITLKEVIDKGPSTIKTINIIDPEETSTLRYIIPPNLTVGDVVSRIPLMFENDSWGTVDLAIDRITNKTYKGVTREVVGITYSWIKKEYVPGLDEIIDLNCSLYIEWDRKTGFMVERTGMVKYPRDMSQPPSAFTLILSDTNIWGTPKTETIPTVMAICSVIVFALGLIFVSKRSRKKIAIVSCASFIILTLLIPNQVAAIAATSPGKVEWAQKWHEYKQYYLTAPINISTTTTVFGPGGYTQFTAVLSVAIYEYEFDPIVKNDVLYFKVGVYVKGNRTNDDYYTPYADWIVLSFEKLTYEFNTSIHIVHDEPPPGYSQGKGLEQRNRIESTYEYRCEWALVVMQWAVSKMSEPLSIASLLISVARSFNPPPGTDIHSAGPGDTYAYSYWQGLWHDDENLNPIRQYCFNTIRWKQSHNVTPSVTPFVIKISAEVYPRRVPYPWILTEPIYLKIYAPDPRPYGGGAGRLPHLALRL